MNINKCFLFNKKEFELFINNFKDYYGFNNKDTEELLISELENSQHQINSSMITLEAENITFNFLVGWDKKEIKELPEAAVWSINSLIWECKYHKKIRWNDEIYIIIPTEE